MMRILEQWPGYIPLYFRQHQPINIQAWIMGAQPVVGSLQPGAYVSVNISYAEKNIYLEDAICFFSFRLTLNTMTLIKLEVM